MNLPFKVLLAEDDEAIVEIVSLGLSYEGAEVVVARDGLQAVTLHRSSAPDIVLLDIMLPHVDGLSALQRMRAVRDTPVILLTAKGELSDRVAGLEAGADDYVTKPFQFPELVARMKAVLRRRGLAGQEGVIEIADLRIDRQAHEVTRGGEPVDLTARQFAILELLAENARRVLSKGQIYESVWGWDALDNPNVVEQHISKLRERVDRGRRPMLIQTVRGIGYMLREEAG
ncbi:MAG: response regulator transcription factor [Acidimicrobiia bacterium]